MSSKDFNKDRNDFFSSKFSRSLKFIGSWTSDFSDLKLDDGSHYAVVIGLDNEVLYHFTVLRDLCYHLDGGTVSINIVDN